MLNCVKEFVRPESVKKVPLIHNHADKDKVSKALMGSSFALKLAAFIGCLLNRKSQKLAPANQYSPVIHFPVL